MALTPEAIDAYKQILSDPGKHGFDFKPLAECFEHSEEATPKHILYEQYGQYINKPLPKLVFYIIMDETYQKLIDKAPNGDLGYKLKLNAAS